MFTGIVESTGEVTAFDTEASAPRLDVYSELAGELIKGESIAINGVCLTVVNLRDKHFEAEVSPETFRVTTLDRLRKGSVVNLERSLRVNGRLGGHFVLGHVDGVGRIRRVLDQAEFKLITVSYDLSLSSYIVPKGSIALDGVSLTVAALCGDEFDVQIVPITWEHTNLATAGPETLVNLECDIIGKYVVRAFHERD
jgi:riboflavin synthase